MNEQDRDPIIRCNIDTVLRFFEGTHSGNLDVIDETVDPDIVTHGFPGGFDPASRVEYRAFFETVERLWPDMSFDIETMVADEHHVAVRFTIEGTHSSDALGVPASGRRVRFAGMVLYRMKDGRIAETWLHPDNMAIMEQIGAWSAAA